MSKHYPPINPKCPDMLHGGDYNPDQWARTPEVWDEDMRLMKLAGCNAMSVGIFAWASLEPAEGEYTFGWLDTIMDKLAANDAFAVLATPSGGKPAWMSRSYPEVRRVNADGTRQPHRARHNHCPTSPVYREKSATINSKLAERYKDHPALLLWHVSNEYNLGDCHCDLCYSAFHDWLRDRYDNDIDQLNHAYWSAFWSHTYPDFDYVEPVDGGVHALMMDWERFKNDQVIDFYKTEAAPLRSISPDVPVTTNFHGRHTMDYGKFAREVDVIAWDMYPNWHENPDIEEAVAYGLLQDRCRSYKGGQPWMLMESVPSIPTRGRAKKRKEPGMHLLSSLQAVAHGSDTVEYFQWRKSRGCMEKFHGAVVDHEGSENTREFREVAEVGKALTSIKDVVGTSVQPKVALIEDWENDLALRHGAKIYLGENIKYGQECTAHYKPFWAMGIPVDVIDQTYELDQYDLVILPLGYMLRPGFADRLKAFVENGGTAVTTFWSAVVDESDLCLLGGVPGAGLREVFGVWEEESQSYFPNETVGVAAAPGNPLGIAGTFEAVDTCSVIHAEGADVLATYTDQYFADTPAVTVNTFGKGKAYYVATRMGDDFYRAFYEAVAGALKLGPVLDCPLPTGVTAQVRNDGETDYIFVMNFNDHEETVKLGTTYPDLLSGDAVGPDLLLERYGVRVLKCSRG